MLCSSDGEAEAASARTLRIVGNDEFRSAPWGRSLRTIFAEGAARLDAASPLLLATTLSLPSGFALRSRSLRSIRMPLVAVCSATLRSTRQDDVGAACTAAAAKRMTGINGTISPPSAPSESD